jgi:hypothetical protein
LDRRLGEPQSRSERCGEEKIYTSFDNIFSYFTDSNFSFVGFQVLVVVSVKRAVFWVAV